MRLDEARTLTAGDSWLARKTAYESFIPALIPGLVQRQVQVETGRYSPAQWLMTLKDETRTVASIGVLYTAREFMAPSKSCFVDTVAAYGRW